MKINGAVASYNTNINNHGSSFSREVTKDWKAGFDSLTGLPRPD
jgi:hypothetical protein